MKNLAVFVLLVLAVLLAAGSVFMFARKGPLPVYHYLMMKPEQREAVRTPKEYRNAGVALLLLAAGCAASLIVQRFFPTWLVKYIVVLAACALLYFVCYDLTPRKWEDTPESQAGKRKSTDIF